MPSFLKTDGARHIGSHICKARKNDGYEPMTFDNLSHGHRSAAVIHLAESITTYGKTKWITEQLFEDFYHAHSLSDLAQAQISAVNWVQTSSFLTSI